MGDQQLGKVNEQADKATIRRGRLVTEMMATKGWKDVVSPMLEQMFVGLVGGKVNGKIYTGMFGIGGKARIKDTDMEPRDILWYRQALVDIHNNIHGFVKTGQAVKTRRKNAKKPGKEVDPMLSGDYFESDEDTIRSIYGNDGGVI